MGCATIAWILLPMPPAYVALATVAGLAALGVVPQTALTGLLGADIIWLMVGAFILGEAMTSSQLAQRLNGFMLARAARVGQLFWMVSAVLLLLTFIIPSTSGRAAVLLPLYRSLGEVLDARSLRALALLIPTIILVTTIASLTGAGSHLIANDLLGELAGRRIGFLEWVLYGLPFAIAAAALSCLVVLRLFVSAPTRARPLAISVVTSGPWSRDERYVAIVAVALLAMWLTEGLHGVGIAASAMLGALLLTGPGGPLRWSQGVKAVNLDLLVFVGAALLLGKALIETGAAAAATGALFAGVRFANGMNPLTLIACLAALTLASHLLVTSHAARAAALVPPLIGLAATLKVDAATLVFIGTVGMNYCQTLPVSSKALLMFQSEQAGLRPYDLVRLSAVLAPAHLLLMIAFYFGYWRWVGLSL
jgi:di/tricarboxylate transporter